MKQQWYEWVLNDQVYPDKIFIVLSRQLFILSAAIYLYFLQPKDIVAAISIFSIFSLILVFTSILWQDKLIKNRLWLDVLLRTCSAAMQAAILTHLASIIPDGRSRLSIAFLATMPLHESSSIRSAFIIVCLSTVMLMTSPTTIADVIVIVICIVNTLLSACYKTLVMLAANRTPANNKQELPKYNVKSPKSRPDIICMPQTKSIFSLKYEKKNGSRNHTRYRKADTLNIGMRCSLKQMHDLGDVINFSSNSQIRRLVSYAVKRSHDKEDEDDTANQVMASAIQISNLIRNLIPATGLWAHAEE